MTLGRATLVALLALLGLAVLAVTSPEPAGDPGPYCAGARSSLTPSTVHPQCTSSQP